MPPPYSGADAEESFQNSWLDQGWPLTRFLGYRPPPADPVAARHPSAWMDHVLPAARRERHRARRRDQQLRKERTLAIPIGAPEEWRGEVKTGAESSSHRHRETRLNNAGMKGPSLGDRVRHKAWEMWLTLIGCFFGVAFAALSSRAHYLRQHDAPLIVAAFGAEAVLLYGAHNSPFTQPVNILVGNPLSAILGVCVAKLFALIPSFRVGGVYESNWEAASVSLALALAVMQLLEVTHPPGGATALLAVTIPQISQMGWWYVPMVLQTDLIMLSWALVINNIGGRRYPTRWFWKSRWVVI
ncbi:hypothetical protein JCM3774_002177 [Rhodotorula dairenensis]